jgi:hypothetical protein
MLLVLDGPNPQGTATPYLCMLSGKPIACPKVPPVVVVHSDGVPVWLTIVLILCALGAALAFGRRRGALAMRRQDPPLIPNLAETAADDWRRAAGQGPGRPIPPLPPERPPADSRPAAERAKLVESCADPADRLRNPEPARPSSGRGSTTCPNWMAPTGSTTRKIRVATSSRDASSGDAAGPANVPPSARGR